MFIKDTLFKLISLISEVTGGYSQILNDNIDAILSTGICGFVIGSIGRTAEHTEAFKKHNQIAVFQNKKTSHVINSVSINFNRLNK